MTNKEVHKAWKVMLKHGIDVGEHQCCLNCLQFDKKSDTCYKYNAKPPAEVIMFSCDAGWEDDIPF